MLTSIYKVAVYQKDHSEPSAVFTVEATSIELMKHNCLAVDGTVLKFSENVYLTIDRISDG